MDEKVKKVIEYINTEITEIEKELNDPNTDMYEEGQTMKAELWAYRRILKMLTE